MGPLLVDHRFPGQRVQFGTAGEDHETTRARVGQKRAQLRRELRDRCEQVAPGAADDLQRPAQRRELALLCLRRALDLGGRIAPALIAERRREAAGRDDAAVDGQLERVFALDVERPEFSRRADLPQPQDRGAPCHGCHDPGLRGSGLSPSPTRGNDRTLRAPRPRRCGSSDR